jgi:hypothetical protein
LEAEEWDGVFTLAEVIGANDTAPKENSFLLKSDEKNHNLD